MQLILASIASGGLVGVSDQYLCLLILSVAARLGWVTVTPTMEFMTTYWFMAVVGVLWLLTIAPSFASFFAPWVMNAINTVVNFLSGFVVPFSSALVALAAVGVISGLDPDLKVLIDVFGIFNGPGGVGAAGWGVAAASAVTAVTLTATKAAIKPGLSLATGTTGHLAAPAYKSIENASSIVVMALIYILSKINPWLLVVLLGVVVLITIVLLVYALYQLRRLKRGIGRVLYMAQINPRAGLSIVVEFFVWGIGWLVWGKWGRAAISLAALIIFGVVAFTVTTSALALFFPLGFMIGLMAFSIYCLLGFGTAGALLQILEKEIIVEKAATAGIM